MSGPYDHDGQHHSHAENQGQNLLLSSPKKFSPTFRHFSCVFAKDPVKWNQPFRQEE